jgi:beta-lactamase regulating signal transducer with metallopeptidase domain/protocatechuate 3,4-dioxygenase beta subunit
MNASIDWLNRFVPAWQFHTFHATWQSMVVASILMLVVASGRRWPAPLRYSLLLVALLKFAMPPLLTLPVGLLSHIETEQISQQVSVTTPLVETPTEIVTAQGLSNPDGGFMSMPGTQSTPSLSPPPPTPDSAPTPTNALASSAAQAASSLQTAGWLMVGHLTGAALLAFWILYQFLALARLSRRATELQDGPLFDLYASLADQLGFRRRPRLLLLNQPVAPIAFGALHPVVLLSRSLADRLSPEELRTVLSHELAHHRRRDPLVILFQLVVLVAWWFNPVLWLLMRQIRKVREDCCDDLLLERALTSSETYCETLLRASRELAQGAVPVGAALGFAESVHPLARRLRRIMDLRLRRHSRLSLVGLLVVLVLAGALLPGVRSRAGGVSKEEKKEASVEQKGDPKDAPSEQKTGPNQASAGQQEPRPEWIADFKPSGVLSGRILGEDGKPVVGARIQASPNGNVRQMPKEVVTDARGDYTIPEIYGDCEYTFTLISRDHIGFPVSIGAPILFLKRDQPIVQHFVLKKACQIEVLVVDENGQPTEKAEVYVTSRSGREEYPYSQGERPDPTGKVRLGGLEPSSTPYLITSVCEGYAPGKLVVTLKEPARIETGKIVMQKGVSVKARAICSDGKPPTGWSIVIDPRWWDLNLSLEKYPVDSEGNVTLEHVLPGDYTVWYYLPSGRGKYVMDATLPPPTEPLEIRIAQSSPGSLVSISGTVDCGSIRRKDQIFVTARQPRSGYVDSIHIAPDQTEFKIDNLPPGLYNLSFGSLELMTRTIDNVQAPGSGLKVDLAFRKKFRLKGIVLDSVTGRPIPKFRVRLKEVKMTYGQDNKWRPFEDPQGRFEFEVDNSNVYQVQVAAEGWAWTWSPKIDTDRNGEEPVTIRLSNKGSASIRGRVVDEQGRAVSGARVLPRSKAGRLEEWLMDQFVSEEGAVETGSDGRFSLDQLSSGTETLKVVHPDFAPEIVSDIRLKPDQVVDAGQITLKRGGTVEGHAYDADGKPLPNATLLFLHQPYYGDPNELKGKQLASAITDAQGYYRVEHLPEQTCYIHRRTEEWPFKGISRQAILPVNGRTLTVDLGGENRVSGRILDSGKPLAGHRIRLSGLSPDFGEFQSLLSTDSNGGFVFRGIPAGRHTVYAEMPGARVTCVPLKTLDLKPSDTTPQSEIALGDLPLPTGRVSISAVTEDSKPTTLTAFVSIGRKTGEVEYAGCIQPATEPDAPRVITRLSPGHYTAMLPSDQLIHTEPFEIGPDSQNLQVTLKVAKGSAVLQGSCGTIETKLGLIRLDKRINANIVPKDHRYRIGGLPAGTYQIMSPVMSPGNEPVPVLTVTLAEGEVKNLDLKGPEWDRIAAMTSLFVLTFDAKGLGLPGTEAWLEGKDGTLKPERSGEISHSFIGQPGDYTLHVRYPGYRERVQTVRMEPRPKPDASQAARTLQPTVNVRLERD